MGSGIVAAKAGAGTWVDARAELELELELQLELQRCGGCPTGIEKELWTRGPTRY